MTTFSDFIQSETHLSFRTTKYDVKIEYFKHSYMSKYCLVHVFSKTKTKTRTLDSLIIEKDLIAHANSCTALLKVFETVKATKWFNHYMDELCYLYDDYLEKQSTSAPLSALNVQGVNLFFTPDELNIIQYCLSNYSQYFADNDDLDSVNDLLDKIQSFASAPACLEH